jgi:putative ABC transport system permease protein
VPGAGILRVAGRLVPRLRREEWEAEWRAELAWDAERRRARGEAAWRVVAALRLRALASLLDAWPLRRGVLAAGPVAADVRLALRQFGREPLVHAVIVLTLALGFGANAAIFSVVKSVLLGSLPFEDPDRVVRVWMRNPERGWPRLDGSLPDFEDLGASLSSIEALAGYNVRDGNLGGLGEAQRVEYVLVTPRFFALAGVRPQRGRFLDEGDDVAGANDVVVVSHAFWQVRLGGAPDVVGRTIRLDGSPVRVVGVAPPGFAFPTRRTELWKPLALHGLEAGPRDARWLAMIGRRVTGADREGANAELGAVTARLEEAYPESNAGWDAWAELLHDVAVAGVRTPLLVAWAAALLVLLIAVANIANLQVARTVGREHEIAIRGVLGAGRGAILRQLLIESLVVALAGAGLGALLAGPGVRLVSRVGQTSMQVGAPPGVDGRVLLYTLLVALATGAAMGLLPAIRGAAGGPAASLRRGARGMVQGSSGVRAGLVSLEVALAVTILVGAGLLGRSLSALRAVDVGVPLEDRLTLRVAPPWQGYPERSQAVDFYRSVERGIRGVPGVAHVGAANRLPLEGQWWTGGIVLRDRPAPARNAQPLALNRVITPGYIEALGLRLLAGRLLTESDVADAPRVVLISESLARRHWPAADPVGEGIAFAPALGAEVQWSTIAGVVSDVRYDDLGGDPSEVIYTTLAQARWGHFDDWGMGLVIASRGDPLAPLPEVRAVVAGVDPGLPLYDVRTMAGRASALLEARSRATTLIAAFAALALLLAAVGTWAVIAFNVNRQVREIGLRLALGETPAAVLRRTLARGLAPVLAGIAIGLPAAALAARTLRSQLFGIEPLDAATFAAITGVTAAVAVAACWLPARRASRLAPLAALRTE